MAGLKRVWFAKGLIALTVLAEAALLFWPSDFERIWRMVLAQILGALAAIFIVGWFVFFSGAAGRRRGTVLGLVLAGIAAGALLVKRIEFTGDITPIFHWRFAKTHDDVLEADREKRSAKSSGPSDPAALADLAQASFPGYRGVARDGIVDGPPLAMDWSKEPPRLLWRQPVGGGYSSIAIEGGLAVTLEQRREREVVVAYDVADGAERWKYEYPARFTETMGGDGPRATPTIAEGKVYSLGATGVLVCLDLASGTKKWKENVLEAHHDPNLTWGMSGSPLVYNKLVVVNPGAQAPQAADFALVALDRENGKRVWNAGTHKAGYASPMLATLGGKRQILIFDGVGVGGHDAETGAELWRYPWTTQEGINVAQPLVLGEDRVFISSGYGVGGAVIQVEEKDGAWSAREIWKNILLRCRFTSPVLREGHIYGLNEGVLVCLDAKDGKRRWQGGKYRHGQILLNGDQILVLGEQGELALVKADPEKFTELARIQAIEGKTWNYPALAGGYAFVRNHLEMAVYDLVGVRGSMQTAGR